MTSTHIQLETMDYSLPTGWQHYKDENGISYYHHNESNTTQWNTPTVTDSENDLENEEKKQIIVEEITNELPAGWIEINNDQGIYYYNEELNITQWENPTNCNAEEKSKEILLQTNEEKANEIIEQTPFTPTTISDTEQLTNVTIQKYKTGNHEGFEYAPVDLDDSDTNIKNISDSKSNETHAKIEIKSALREMKESCLLLLKSTPYKSRIVKVDGYNIFVKCWQLNKKTVNCYCKCCKCKHPKWIPSVLLALLLLLIPLVNPYIDLINFNTGNVCEDSSEQVDKYLEDYKNVTQYYQVKHIGPKSKNITIDLYDRGVNNYSSKYSKSKDIKIIDKQYLFQTTFKNNTNLTANCYTDSTSCYSPQFNQSYTCFNDTPSNCSYWIRGRYIENGVKFPTPYQQSESDLWKKSERTCKKPVCVDDMLLGILCKTFEFQCNLQLDTNGLSFEGDEFDTSMHSNFSKINADDVVNTGKDLLYGIYDKRKFFGSLYCVDMALMIFLGGPYIMTSTRLSSKIRKGLNNVTKIWFVAILLILYYLIEIIIHLWELFVIDTNLLIKLKFSIVDPCFADTTFMSDLFKGGAAICSEIEYSQSLYDASVNNLIYYESVEQTYKYYYFADKEYIENNPADWPLFEYNNETDRIFYNSELILSDQYNVTYPQNITSCEIGTMLDYIGPSESNLNFKSIVLFSSIIAALLLQPILANLIRSLFILYDPLSLHCGRVEMPYQCLNEDNDIDQIDNDDISMDNFHRDILNELNEDNRQEKMQKKIDAENAELEKIVIHIKQWERRKNWCGCCCWFVLMGLILANLIISWAQ